MIGSDNLGILVYTIDTTTFYKLTKGNVVIGSARILRHAAHDELAYVEINEDQRGHGYSKILITYALYHHPAQNIYAASIIPELFYKLGFTKIDHYPAFIDHQHPDCQACEPTKCTPLIFSKPAILEPFTEEHPGFAVYRSLLKEGRPMLSELSLVNQYAWSFSENVYALTIDDYYFMILYPFNDKPFGILLPYQNIPASVMEKYCHALHGLNIHECHYLSNRTKRFIKHIQGLHIEEDRNNFDYLYKVKDFAEYKGGKYEKKRNRLKKFLKLNPNHHVIDITSEHIPAILTFAKKTMVDMGISSISNSVLHIAIHRPETRGFFIKVGEHITGFILYSELNEKTIIVHFELLDENYDGVGAFLNNQLGQRLLGKYLFINREQDLGEPGLRRSKMEYRPYRLLKKYKAKST